MKMLKRIAPALCALALTVPCMQATGWPANYEGVMLQGFYWDSYSDSKWTKLESQADELSQYFKLIWIPNSGSCGGGNNMGYMPQYWFTNHNSSFGTEEQLLSMIETFKAKGTGFIADVVVNHRVGTSNWTNFPREEWNGQSWFIGPEGICCTDEVANQPGQAKPTGAPDTGDDFNGARDLDHTNANVQNNVKNYCKCLLEKYGYTGFRYDMVKGYGGQYTKIYNQYSKPKFSVGEYWDGSYDAVAGWINSTGKESAAFDFPGKYAINEAFANNDMTKLVWKANGTTDQPAGMIHFGYAQYSVTFIDNHDTYRDGSKFNGNVVAANAFILCSPGTPCVFLPHWKQHKAEIKALINVRNAVGVHNMSDVKVLRSDRNCYMAEVTGSKGKLVVKIGSAQVAPDGYTNSDIKASGNDYCVWSKTGVSPDPNPNPDPDPDPNPEVPAKLYVVGNLKGASWVTNKAVELNKKDNVFKGTVELAHVAGETHSFFTLITNNGASWDEVNGSDRYGASTKDEAISAGTPTTVVRFPANENASSAYSWKASDGVYNITVDFSTMKITLTSSSDPNPDPDPDPDPNPSADNVVIFFHNTSWTTPHIHYWGDTESTWPGVAMKQVGESVWSYTAPKGTTGVLFNNGDGDATKTADMVAAAGHVYTVDGDQGHFAGTDEKVYIMGNIAGAHWDTSAGIEMKGNSVVYTAKGVELEVQPSGERAAGSGKAYFNITTTLGAGWDDINMSHRFGAATESADPASDNAMTFYHKDVNGSATSSWAVAPGKYDITADFATMTVTVKPSNPSAVEDITVDDATPVYYNLQGMRVSADSLVPGVYIVRRGAKTSKVMVR